MAVDQWKGGWDLILASWIPGNITYSLQPMSSLCNKFWACHDIELFFCLGLLLWQVLTCWWQTLLLPSTFFLVDFPYRPLLSLKFFISNCVYDINCHDFSTPLTHSYLNPSEHAAFLLMQQQFQHCLQTHRQGTCYCGLAGWPIPCWCQAPTSSHQTLHRDPTDKCQAFITLSATDFITPGDLPSTPSNIIFPQEWEIRVLTLEAYQLLMDQ